MSNYSPDKILSQFEKIETVRHHPARLKDTQITLSHGSGGKATHNLIEALFAQAFANPLLDKLDDGWKPFWLDTLAIEPGQTQRIAFLAEYAGRWLIEQVDTDWAAPRLVRWYSVE